MWGFINRPARIEPWNIEVGNKIQVHNILQTRLQILSCSNAELMLMFQAGTVFPLGGNKWLNDVFLLAEQPGEAEQAGQAVPLPRVARDWDSSRGERDDRPHWSCAETAAADREPPHHCALQVSPSAPQPGRSVPLTFLFPRFYPSLCCFHCSAGAGRTGTFIALSNILERVKAEGLLDVFQAVKSLRLQRPHMVQTLVWD